jgi:hypothetical protein
MRMSAKKFSALDVIENVESRVAPTGGMLEEERIDMTRRILFKLDTRCVIENGINDTDSGTHN